MASSELRAEAERAGRGFWCRQTTASSSTIRGRPRDHRAGPAGLARCHSRSDRVCGCTPWRRFSAMRAWNRPRGDGRGAPVPAATAAVSSAPTAAPPATPLPTGFTAPAVAPTAAPTESTSTLQPAVAPTTLLTVDPQAAEELTQAYIRYWDLTTEALITLDASRLSEVATEGELGGAAAKSNT